MGVSDFDFVLRLLLATGCGFLIGLERQFRSRTAGLRTNTLVAAGAASFVLFGQQAGLPQAPLQIAAYVVTGVGFLGGGVILRQGFTIQGLNTAATLWCTAAIGCQAAGGYLIPALTLTAVVLAVHLLLRPLGWLIDRSPTNQPADLGEYLLTLRIDADQENHLRSHLLHALDSPPVTVQEIKHSGRRSSSEGHPATVKLAVKLLIEGDAPTFLDRTVAQLANEPGIHRLTWKATETENQTTDEDDIPPRHGWFKNRH